MAWSVTSYGCNSCTVKNPAQTGWKTKCVGTAADETKDVNGSSNAVALTLILWTHHVERTVTGKHHARPNERSEKGLLRCGSTITTAIDAPLSSLSWLEQD